MFSLLTQREMGLFNPAEVRTLVSCRRSQKLELSNLKDFVNPHGSSYACLDLDPIEDRYLLASAGNGSIAIYDLQSGLTGGLKTSYEAVCCIGRSHEHAHKYSVETVQWYPVDAGMFLASGGDKTVTVWDPNLLLPAEKFQVGGFVYNHHMSPVATEHSLVAVASESPYVKLLDLRSGSDAQILKGHRGNVMCVRWSPRRPYELATGSKDNRILMWDVRMARPDYLTFDQHNGKGKKVSREALNTAHSGSVVGLTFTADGSHLLSYGTDGQLRLWDARDGRNLKRNYGKWSLTKTQRSLKMAVTSGPNEAAVVYLPVDNNIQSLNAWTGEHLQTLSGHYGQVNCCLSHARTQEVYSGSVDKQLLAWTPDGEAEAVYAEEAKKQAKRSEEPSGEARVVTNRHAQDSWSSDED